MAAASSPRKSSVSDILEDHLQDVLKTTVPPALPKKGPVEQLLSLNTFKRWVREKTGFALFGEVRMSGIGMMRRCGDGAALTVRGVTHRWSDGDMHAAANGRRQTATPLRARP
jgi:hypothetical protein